jgi:hypothetical protein
MSPSQEVGDAGCEVVALLRGDRVRPLDKRLQQVEQGGVALRENGARVEAAQRRERPEVQALVIAERR